MPRNTTLAQPRRRATLFVALTAALAAQALALPALAQETPAADSDELDRIVVTAQKREQQIEDVPIAINAYSGEFLEAQGIVDYGDLGSLVPGLEVQTQSVSNPSISIRGITADLDDPTQEPRISLYQDGVSISRARGSSVELFDLQRVEVLRGPQGTLFGRAAETGAVHIIQNKAREGRSGSFELGWAATTSAASRVISTPTWARTCRAASPRSTRHATATWTTSTAARCRARTRARSAARCISTSARPAAST